MSGIRTWTLEGMMRPGCLVVIREPNAPPSSDHERTAVIELEPILDMLETWVADSPDSQLWLEECGNENEKASVALLARYRPPNP